MPRDSPLASPSRRARGGSSHAGSDGTEDELDDEPLLKYQRMRADVGKLLESGAQVVRLAMHDTFIAVATADGFVHLVDFHGNERRRLRPHQSRINDLCIDVTGEYLASCGEDGAVIVSCLQFTGDDGSAGGGETSNRTAPEAPSGTSQEKFQYRKPMRAVCLDPQYARRRDKLFVAGGDRGELVLNRKGWFSHKETVLHEGEGPITAAAWRGSFVAWANDQGLKIMDVEREERISYVDKPRAAVAAKGVARGCGCQLLWEADSCLLVAWADTVMVINVITKEASAASSSSRNDGGPSGSAVTGLTAIASSSTRRVAASLRESTAALVPAAIPQRTAEIVAIWQADCIVCGISPFDAQSLVLLGVVPDPEAGRAGPADDDDDGDDQEEEGEDSLFGGGGGGEQPHHLPPEVQLVNRSTGEVLSADAVPLRGWEEATAGDYMLRSMLWLASAPRQAAVSAQNGEAEASSSGGGFRLDGPPPAIFLASPYDVVLARVRDMDDQIAWSLERGDYWGALQAALANRNMLRLHRFEDLLATYLEDLLDRGLFRDAAAECATLLGDEVTAWERWIYAFARRGHLAMVAPVVPTASPRLPPAVYEMILEQLLGSEPALFLETVKRWGDPRAGTAASPTQLAPSVHGPAMRSQDDAFGNYSSAAASSLPQAAGVSGANAATAAAAAAGSSAAGASFRGGAGAANDDDDDEEGRRELYSLPLVMARTEAALARQFHPLVTEAQAELLVMDGQFDRAVEIYLSLADQAPPSTPPAAAAAMDASSGSLGVSVGGDAAAGGEGGRDYSQVFRLIETHGLWGRAAEGLPRLVRLDRAKAGELLLKFVDKLPVASVVQKLKGRRDLLHWYLQLLFTQAPELYGAPEYAQFHIMQVSLHAEFAPPFEPGRNAPYDSAFLSFLRGSPYAPLELALSECEKRRPPLYDEMVFILGKLGSTRRAVGLLLEKIGNVRRAIEFVESHDKELWYQLIDYSLRDEAFLTGLLDHAGVYNVDLARLVSEVPEGMRIQGLRGKLIKILSDYGFQAALHEACKSTMRSDCLAQLRTLNQRQRRALSVSAVAVCCYSLCSMPLSGPPAGFRPTRHPAITSGGGSSSAALRRGKLARVNGSGGGGGGSGVYVFACGHGYHSHCLMVGAERGAAAVVRPGARGALVDCAVCDARQRARPPS